MVNRWVVLLTSLLALTGATGCNLVRQGTSGWFGPTAPVAFATAPTADDVVRVVNSNSAPIRQLSTDSATLTVAGYPPLRANLALERPKRFRLQASLLGPELDLGSNDDLFWIWIQRAPEHAVLYSRHDTFARSPIKQQIPLEPLWLTEVLGVVQLDPLAHYEGPVAGPQGELTLRSVVDTPQGPVTRSYVVHPTYGWLLQQHVHDARGQLLASARASRHRFDATTGVSLPYHVEISVPSADLNLTLNVGGYQINQPVGNPDLLWSLPNLEGYPLVDISDPRLQLPPPPRASSSGAVGGLPPVTVPAGRATNPGPAMPTYTPQPPPGASQPRYRGYTSPWR